MLLCNKFQIFYATLKLILLKSEGFSKIREKVSIIFIVICLEADCIYHSKSSLSFIYILFNIICSFSLGEKLCANLILAEMPNLCAYRVYKL